MLHVYSAKTSRRQIQLTQQQTVLAEKQASARLNFENISWTQQPDGSRVAWEMCLKIKGQYPSLAQHFRVTDYTRPIDLFQC